MQDYRAVLMEVINFEKQPLKDLNSSTSSTNKWLSKVQGRKVSHELVLCSLLKCSISDIYPLSLTVPISGAKESQSQFLVPFSCCLHAELSR